MSNVFLLCFTNLQNWTDSHFIMEPNISCILQERERGGGGDREEERESEWEAKTFIFGRWWTDEADLAGLGLLSGSGLSLSDASDLTMHQFKLWRGTAQTWTRHFLLPLHDGSHRQSLFHLHMWRLTWHVRSKSGWDESLKESWTRCLSISLKWNNQTCWCQYWTFYCQRWSMSA